MRCRKTGQLSASHSHAAVVQTLCQINVPQPSMSSGHASMPSRQHVDVRLDSSGCFQAYTAASLMGNRLTDCAVATCQHHQTVPQLMDTRTYRDCSQWRPTLAYPAVLQHSNDTHWSSGHQVAASCDIERSVWMSLQSAVTVNGTTGARQNVPSHASQVYVHQLCSEMPSQFQPGSVSAGRFSAVTHPAVSVQQMWMPARPHQQHLQNSMTMSPVQSGALISVGHSSTLPPPAINMPTHDWRSTFALQSLSSARQSVTAALSTETARTLPAQCTTAMSVAESCHMTGPSHSPVTAGPVAVSLCQSSAVHNNRLGRIYQLPIETVAMSSVHSSQHDTPQISSPVTVSLSTPVMTPTKSVVDVKAPVKAVITASQPEPERTYVAGRRYTITKEDGVTVEGIWDGKYLTVLTTTTANSTMSQTSGQLLCSVCCVFMQIIYWL